MLKKYDRGPVYSKFFDNMGPIPHHMHQGFKDAKLVGQEGKPESYYFPPQYNNVDNNFANRSWASNPATPKSQFPSVSKIGTRGTTASSIPPLPIPFTPAPPASSPPPP